MTLDAVGGQQLASTSRTARQTFTLTAAGPHTISMVDGTRHAVGVVFEVDQL